MTFDVPLQLENQFRRGIAPPNTPVVGWEVDMVDGYLAENREMALSVQGQARRDRRRKGALLSSPLTKSESRARLPLPSPLLEERRTAQEKDPLEIRRIR